MSAARSGGSDQPRLLAKELEMHYHFHPALEADDGHYGDALFSRYPLQLVRGGCPCRRRRAGLPGKDAARSGRPSNAKAGPCKLSTRHLGLTRRERVAQVKRSWGLIGWGTRNCSGPTILCGDLNSWPGSAPYRLLRREFFDAQESAAGWPRNTFPRAVRSCGSITCFCAGQRARRIQVPRSRLTQMASDHLPLVVEMAFHG